MGFMSNQWLNRGQGVRNRSYNPVPVEVSVEKATDGWSQRNEIRAAFTARKKYSAQHQTLHLTELEADKLASTIASCMSRKGREKLLLGLLKELSDAMLLRVLALDLRARKRRLPKAP